MAFINMRTKNFYLGFSVLILLYSLLYIATSKHECDDECKAVEAVMEMVRTKPNVMNANQCRQNGVCITVQNPATVNAKILADTTCLLLKQKQLTQFTVTITNATNSDTLVHQQCN